MIVFNSWEYILFLCAVVLVYWRLKQPFQNWLLLLASLFFYASWDWRFLGLIFLSTSVDYFAAIQISIAGNIRTRRLWLFASIAVNLLILAVFKYASFFLNNLESLLNTFSIHVSRNILGVILPVGISFYTFKAIGYVIEVYRKTVEPVRSLISYMLFVAFFPLMVAGPIERAKNLIPQISSTRTFCWAGTFEGIDLIIWGLVKKVVIADNIAYYVTLIFNLQNPSTLLIVIGCLGFGIQLFADFSGYTDIARGSSKLFGFHIIKNFDLPYLARNPSDFWKRWHISLSSYVRDYVYFPLGGSRCSKLRYLYNIVITWFIMGLWHGAEWHYVIWGLYHGFLIAAHKLFFKGKAMLGWVYRPVRTAFSVFLTYCLVNLGWVFFRTDNICKIPAYFNLKALALSLGDWKVAVVLVLFILFYSIPLGLALFCSILRPRIEMYLLPSLRIVYYTSALLILIVFGGIKYDFVYFQF